MEDGEQQYKMMPPEMCEESQTPYDNASTSKNKLSSNSAAETLKEMCSDPRITGYKCKMCSFVGKRFCYTYRHWKREHKNKNEVFTKGYFQL